jgi:hypothetical protein
MILRTNGIRKHGAHASHVLSDISGKSGQAIIHAILEGERDPYELAALCELNVKASEEKIARALEGNWQEDLLFMLKQEQDGYEFCQKQMAECDQQLYTYLQRRPDRSAGASLWKRSERDGGKRRGRISRISTCVSNYFA